MPELTPELRRELRARAHALSPVVSIASKGLSAAVLKEIDRSLQAHELIKVRIYGAERDDRERYLEEICTALSAQPVQHIGNILVLFRERPQPDAVVPKSPPKVPARTPARTQARPGTKNLARSRTPATATPTARRSASGPNQRTARSGMRAEPASTRTAQPPRRRLVKK
ncbi:MAG: ribosome assembly RNA-binding protein YhbY [Rhodocyclaceae bacterium]|nr:ribosome assembly RNA-binding protein YhbY [Rhodocyclaceae bacterium]MBX3667777.1 ribosome assembly RNA-binding protein YhbY [Rhodocyclaceae bacterium]